MKFSLYLKLVLVLVASFVLLGPKGYATEPHSHGRMGSHGMVLLTDGEKLFASHLPLYRVPHDMQIIYEIRIRDKQQALIRLAEQKMVTLLPEVFDLDILVAGKPLTVTAQFYTGHFERGGNKWHEPLQTEFVAARHLRPLAELSQQSGTKEVIYNRLPVDSAGTFLWVREIQQAPSADHVVVVESKTSADCQVTMPDRLSFNWQPESLPSQRQQFRQQLHHCYQILNEYWETADFAQ